MQGSCFLPLLLVVFLWLHNIADSADTSCPKTFNGTTTRAYAQCENLSQLGATLSWTYHPGNGSVDLAFRAKPGSSSGWVAWGINPSGGGMVGTQALLALRQSNGTMACKTYNVTSKKAALVPSAISFPATHLISEYENGLMTIFAKVVLPSNKSKVKHVWQVGSQAQGLDPSIHAMANGNLNSLGSIDLASANASSSSSSTSSASPTASTSSGSIARISLTTLLFFLGFSATMFYYI